jgi:cytochrome b561
MNSVSGLCKKTIYLHWLVGTVMIALLISGIYMVEAEQYALYDWHKPFGLSLIFLVIARLVWRMKKGWPSQLTTHSAIEKKASRSVQYMLLLLSVVMPLSGLLMASMGGYGLDFFGIELVPATPDPANPDEMIPANGPLAGFASSVHELSGYLLIGVLTLHILGALKHHFIDGDTTLKRMLKSD